MGYQAKVLRVMIASPSDVSAERNAVVECIQKWNDLNSSEKKVVLLPLRWETHSRPELGARPQEIINTTIVDYCDLLIGIFWTRIGSDAGIGATGTVEEIERVLQARKPVLLYFSGALIEPSKIDTKQLSDLNGFREKVLKQGLVESYGSIQEFMEKISRHLEMKVRELLLVASEGEGDLSGGPIAGLDLQLVDPETDSVVGKELMLSGKNMPLDTFSSIPDYSEEEPEDKLSSKLGLGSISLSSFSKVNRDYLREVVVKTLQDNLFRPIRFSLTNIGMIGIRDIFVEISLESKEPFYFVSSRDLISKPEKRLEQWAMREHKDLEKIKTTSTSWSTTFERNALQPKRSILMPVLGYIGAPVSSEISVNATIFGDCFPEPKRETMQITFTTEQLNFTAVALSQYLLEEEKVVEKKGTGRKIGKKTSEESSEAPEN